MNRLEWWLKENKPIDIKHVPQKSVCRKCLHLQRCDKRDDLRSRGYTTYCPMFERWKNVQKDINT